MDMTQMINLSFLPWLAPIPPSDLVRLGGKHDGGYLVSREAVLASKSLLSLGIAYDIEFESAFISLNPNLEGLHLYDHTTRPFSAQYILSRILRSIEFFSPKPFIGYIKFLQKRRKLLKQKAKFFGVKISDNNLNNNSTLTGALNLISQNRGRVFLKIDIEGDEYLILSELILHVDFISGLIIEFHDVSLHLDAVKNLVDSLKNEGLLMDHFHINNYGGLNLNSLPNVIELSFSRSKRDGNHRVKLPLVGLDAPNSPLRGDFEVTF
jgi:hypothetical protein